MIDLGLTDNQLVMALQLGTACIISVHVFLLRPHLARQSLRLSARIIGGSLQISEEQLRVLPGDEVEATHRFLDRVANEPRSAATVIENIDQELDRGQVGAHTGYLEQLRDACVRYLADAWPMAGASDTGADRPTLGPGQSSPVPLPPSEIEPADRAPSPRALPPRAPSPRAPSPRALPPRALPPAHGKATPAWSAARPTMGPDEPATLGVPSETVTVDIRRSDGLRDEGRLLTVCLADEPEPGASNAKHRH